MTNYHTLADAIEHAYATATIFPAPSSVDPTLDLAAAYAVEAELVRRRRAAGHRTVGRKVGFANKAMWRILKLDTLVFAHMYEDTVSTNLSLSLNGRIAPKIEPEIVFKLKDPIEPGLDAAAVLERTEWLALGFEVNDCIFPDWKFQPADFVAAYGFHIALVVGEPLQIEVALIPALVEQLAACSLTLTRDGALVETGSGRNSLKNPALCVSELAAAIARYADAEPLSAAELVSTGTLTTPQAMHAGDVWRAEVEGIFLQPISLQVL